MLVLPLFCSLTSPTTPLKSPAFLAIRVASSVYCPCDNCIHRGRVVYCWDRTYSRPRGVLYGLTSLHLMGRTYYKCRISNSHYQVADYPLASNDEKRAIPTLYPYNCWGQMYLTSTSTPSSPLSTLIKSSPSNPLTHD